MTRCAHCPGTNPCLPVDGPSNSPVLFVGEAPGKRENQKGRVFIGQVGEELNQHYLPLAGLRRSAVRFTNAIRCTPSTAGGKLDIKRRQDTDLLESCARHHLAEDMVSRPPRYLVALGTFACRALIGEGFDLELNHGIPHPSKWGIPVFPMFHPALGLYEPKKMMMIRFDWMRLRQFLEGTLELPKDPYPFPDYAEVTDVQEVLALDPTRAIGADTETLRGGYPFCLTYSQAPGTGRLIRVERPDLLHAFQRQLQNWRAPILFHNWFYDWTVTEEMGLRFPHRHTVDTMAEVYRLGILPQGLKALSWRELGMEMQDFEDVVKPHSVAKVLDYYRLVQLCDWPKPPEELRINSKTGFWEFYRPQGMNTKIKRFWTDYGKNENKDVFKAWENWESAHAMIEQELGPWPGMCVSHAPFEDVLFYACRDADATLRLWHLIRKMQARVRKQSPQDWRAA